MPGNVAGAHLKLRRAKEHLDAFEEATKGFFDDYSNYFAMDRDIHPNDTFILLKAKQPKQLDPMVGTIVGDFANNAKSALDYIVAHIERLPAYGGTGTSTQFPIFVKDNWGRMKQALGKLAAVPDFVDLIKTHQPYTRLPETPTKDILAILANINNTDKHGSLHTASTWLGIRDLELSGGDSSRVSIEPLGTRMEHDAQLALIHVAYGGDDSHVQVKVGGTFYIALYADTDSSIIPAVPALQLMGNILQRVTDVVAEFENKFL